MLIESLLENFGYNQPIFTEDILKCMNQYSNQRIYQLIEEAIENKKLIRFDMGIYYIPTYNEFGQSLITVNDVVKRKYITDNGEIFGIYGKSVIDLNFLVSYQVPNTIEIITNNESRDIREKEIRGRKIILRKSRVTITNENVDAYTLMELFNQIDVKQYQDNIEIRQSVKEYINKKNITLNKVFELTEYFPARVMKNLTLCGVLYELTR